LASRPAAPKRDDGPTHSEQRHLLSDKQSYYPAATCFLP
jgi:hypothetical protein